MVESINTPQISRPSHVLSAWMSKMFGPSHKIIFKKGSDGET